MHPENGRMVTSEYVNMWYDNFHALQDITFNIRKGEFIGLIGPNGCGKSTLLRVINGLLRIKGGSMIVDDKNIHDLSLPEIAKICSNVPTEFPPDFNLNVIGVVMMGRYPHRKGLWWENDEDEDIAREALKKFEIDHLDTRNINQLSSGERQRTLIAKAYVQQPKLMLVDEPTSHLDLRFKLEVMEYLKGMIKKEQDMSIVIASHDINLMAKYCDRLILVKKGKIVDFGTPEAVISEKSIAEVYGVKASVSIDEDGIVNIIPKHSLKLKE